MKGKSDNYAKTKVRNFFWQDSPEWTRTSSTSMPYNHTSVGLLWMSGQPDAAIST